MARTYSTEAITLIEILIIIAILSVLVLLTTNFLKPQLSKANDAKRKSDLRRIGIALEEYEKDRNCYPAPSLVSCSPGDTLTPYLPKIPCDPVSKASYFYETDNSSCPSWYRISTQLENSQDPDGYNFYLGSPNAPRP